jgi:hypothetical protein
MKVNYNEVITNLKAKKIAKISKESLCYDMGILKEFEGSDKPMDDYTKDYMENLLGSPVQVDQSDVNYVIITCK